MQLVGKDKQPLVDEAVRLAQGNDWKGACAVNQAIVSRFTPTTSDYNRLGAALGHCGRISEAADAYRNALGLSPENTIAQKNLSALESQLEKARILGGKVQVSANQIDADASAGETQHSIQVGADVRIKITRQVGVVQRLLPGRQYQLFVDANTRPIVEEQDIEPLVKVHSFVTPREFLKELLLFKLRSPLSDTLYSYAMSRTNFEAYQFKPAIKFLQSPKGRILIADEVGLGKTIEACIIYLELKARLRGDLPRVLVVCPAALQGKWQTELQTRFGEEFVIVRKAQMLSFLSTYQTNAGIARLRAIASLESLRAVEVAHKIEDVDVQFDLVIVDEAHHMKNPEALSYDIGEALSSHADCLLMLTATPVQLGERDLYSLLTILDPGDFDSHDTFEHQLEPTRLVNGAIAALEKNPPDTRSCEEAVVRLGPYVLGNPYYVEVKNHLALMMRDGNEAAVRTSRVEAMRALQHLNPFAYVFNRTRRREVARGAIRVSSVINVDLTDTEREIYGETLHFARVRAKLAGGRQISMLGLVQIERQVASSLGAFRDVVDDYARRMRIHATIEASDTALNALTTLPHHEMAMLAEHLRNLYAELGDTDSKFDRFYEALQSLLTASPGRKVIVYSFFRRTIAYLERRLTAKGHLLEVIHGDKKPAERQMIMDRFREDPDKQILVSSEVGAEGLDMQFCDAIVNYDLPWNPMRVEQRIGRVDRYGQKSEKVAVVSFFLKDTIEQRILARLYDRIRVFEESIGGLEPILGNIERELPQEVLSQDLTPEQEEQRAEQYLQMLVNKRRDLEHFERSKYELVGNEAVFTQQVEERISSGRYVSPEEVRALVQTYIDERCPACQLDRVATDDHVWLLKPDEAIVDDLSKLLNKPHAAKTYQDWEFWTAMKRTMSSSGGKSSPTEVRLTFSGDIAHQRPLLGFVNIFHPLVRLAYDCLGKETLEAPAARMVAFSTEGVDGVTPGTYAFFLFSITIQGMVDSNELSAIALDVDGKVEPVVSEQMLRLIRENVLVETPSADVVLEDTLMRDLENTAIGYMGIMRQKREEEALRRNEALIAARTNAVRRTYQVKISRAEERLEKSSDERIMRMYSGQIRNLKARMASALDELEQKKQVTVSYQTVAQGVVRVGGQKFISELSS